MMPGEWYYSQEGDRLGPFPFAELRHRANSGSLLPADLVWSESMPDWIAAGVVPGLFPAQASTARKMGTTYQFDPEIDTTGELKATSFFDLDFNKFIAVRIVSILWVLWLALAGLAFLGGIVASAFYLPVVQWLLAIVGALLLFALYSVLIRVLLETLVVIFRISEDLGRIREIAEDRSVKK